MTTILIVLLIAGVLWFAYVLVTKGGKTEATEPFDDDDDADDAPLSEAFIGALKYGREVAVAGESHSNPDGTARNDIIALLHEGDMVALEREPDNRYDSNAIVVRSLKGVIGYVPRDQAAEIAPWIDRGEQIAAYIASIAGGPEEGKANYGVWLRVVSLEQLPAWIEAHDKK